MQQIKTKKGLNLPISGAPEQVIEDKPAAVQVAVLGTDYVGMKPTMLVKQGDKVKKGQALFEDKKIPGVLFTAPQSGTVVAINRGERRMLQSVVIEVSGDQKVKFDSFSEEDLEILGPDQVREQLVASGMWVAFRTRPYSKTPALDATAAAIFVTAIDTNPLAADPKVVVAQQSAAFSAGLKVLSRISTQPIYLCQAPDAGFDNADLENVQLVSFAGKHPAGLVGTHIHHLCPVSANRQVWHINYQDVIAIGKLFTTGELYSKRVVSLAGPQVKNPRLISTEIGAKLSDLLVDELKDGENRVISGSVLNGGAAAGPFDFLRRFDSQISVIECDSKRLFLHYVRPELDKHSVMNLLFSRMFPKRLFDMTTTRNGSIRAMVPLGYYENLIPMDVLPTQLLRAIITIDTDLAQQLGALEMDEEDLALCSYVTSSKVDYGRALRQCLTLIEKDG